MFRFIFRGLCIWLFISPGIVHSQSNMFIQQDKEREMALVELEKYHPQDTKRIRLLENVYDKTTFLSQRLKVKHFVYEAMELSRKLNYQDGLARCYYWHGNFYMSQTKYDSSHIYFDSLIDITAGFNTQFLIRLKALGFRAKAQVYLRLEDYYPALKYYLESQKYFEDHPEVFTHYNYRDIVNIYQYLNNTAKALEYTQYLKEAAQKTDDILLKLNDYLNITGVLLSLNQYSEAENYLDLMAPFMPDTSEITITHGFYIKKALIQQYHQQTDSAIQTLYTALYYARKSQHGNSICEVLSKLSMLLLKSKKFKEAYHFMNENLSISKEKNNKLNLSVAWSNLSEYYLNTGNYKNAFTALQQSNQFKDSLAIEKSAKQINALEISYQNEQKLQTISNLRSQNEIQLQSLQVKNMWNWIFAILLTGLVVIGVLGFHYFKKIQELQKEKIIQYEKDRQIQTIDSMLKGQEEERSRLAKDLHDGLGGMLSGIKMSLVNMKDHLIMSSEDASKFERSIYLMDSSIKELRNVAHNLMPEALLKLGLEEALRDFSSMIEQSTGIKVVYQYYTSGRPLENTVNIYIYRIIQELANNAIKHAAAGQLIIQLSIEEKNINITVEDNGKGFDPGLLRTQKGIGFKNIQYRVDYFQGKMDILSEPEKGTSVFIMLNA